MPASHPLSAQKATIHAWPIVVDVADVEMPSDSPPSATSGKRSSSSQTVMPRSGCGSGPGTSRSRSGCLKSSANTSPARTRRSVSPACLRLFHESAGFASALIPL
jgi:hypothetical protein